MQSIPRMQVNPDLGREPVVWRSRIPGNLTMSKKRGLSLDEKRGKILEIFHESSDVFQLKDIEKWASKRGVVQQTVKEVLQSLVDDDLVHQDKIGISNFFWSFPSEAAVKLDTAQQKLQTQLQGNETSITRLKEQIEAESRGKEDSADRGQMLAHVSVLEADVRKTEAELEEYSGMDPEKFCNMEDAADIARESANRWLDNVEGLLDWAKAKFEGRGTDLEEFFKQNGYTGEMIVLDKE